MYVDVLRIPPRPRRQYDYYHLERENIIKKLQQGISIPLIALHDNVFDFERFRDSKSILESYDYKYKEGERCMLDGYTGQFHLTFVRRTSSGNPLETLLDWDKIFYGFAYDGIKFQDHNEKENFVQYQYY